MRDTMDIDDPTWHDIFDRDDLIKKISNENLVLKNMLNTLNPILISSDIKNHNLYFWYIFTNTMLLFLNSDKIEQEKITSPIIAQHAVSINFLSSASGYFEITQDGRSWINSFLLDKF